jgi:hypothetical protein
MVTLPNSSTIHAHLKKQGVRFGRDFALEFNDKPYFNAGIFHDYIRTIFLRYSDNVRGLTVLAHEIVFLVMDDCSARLSDDIICLLTKVRVRVITYAPHTTPIFQVPFSTIFGVLKRFRAMNCRSMTIMQLSNS